MADTGGTSQRASASGLDSVRRSITELESEIATLRVQIQRNRDARRASASQRKRDKERQMDDFDAALAERLRLLDDDTLTALLTASSASLIRLVARRESTSATLGIDPLFVPSKSAGIEGTGSAAQIDRRLDDPLAQAKGKAKQARWMQHWLKERKDRTDRLLEHLVRFTQLDLQAITTRAVRGTRRLSLSCVFGSSSLDVRFDVTDARMANLEIKLPTHLEAALGSAHLARIRANADLPALLLSLRTMAPLLAVRRDLFAHLASRYPRLVAQPPPAPAPEEQDQDHNALFQLNTLSLANDTRASLAVRFDIRFNRYGHARPALDLLVAGPPASSDIAPQIPSTFRRTLRYLIEKHASPHDAQHMPGPTAALTAIIDAFFRL